MKQLPGNALDSTAFAGSGKETLAMQFRAQAEQVHQQP
jgi:hypothetical protein